jgi:hypothetical protein
LIAAGAALFGGARVALADPPVQHGATVSHDVHHDVSAPLRSIKPAVAAAEHRSYPAKPLPHRAASGSTTGVQSTPGSAAAPTTGLNFLGVGNGFSGPQGSFTVQSAPPDTNAAVGPNHIVEVVNSDFAIFNKSGTTLYGPVATNTLWSGFGGGCQTNDDGDGSVSYDPIADRWVIQQFSVSTTPYLECVAVSQTGDPTGAWYRYSFSFGSTDFPDYPKLSVWPDAYYATYNIFANGSTFSGARACAMDRSKMLTGAAATQQCFNTSASYGGILAATQDGSAQPPAGSPEFVVGLGASASNTIAYWKFHTDWTTPANSTFTGPTELSVASYSEACSGGTCIPQAGTTQQLDSLADRLMYRLAYRNFGDHEALVVNHSVTAGSSTGVRWYELRPDASRNLSVFQQGTYAPDAAYRWMGSIALDQSGDMGLAYSVSSSSLHPEIHYTGRLAGDPVGQMTQGEGTVINGAGSQSGQNLSRWGDYSSIAVDPSDGCTFIVANEYIPATGAFNWATRIASFKFPSCGGTATNDFSLSASPSTVAVTAGGSGTSTISTAVTSGSAQSVALSVSGLPSGATASFNPTSVTAGGSSTLTLNSGTAAAGTYTVVVTGTGTSATHTTSITFTINPAVTNDFSISASPNSLSLAQNTSGTSTISTAVTAGSAQTVALSISGLPAGASASFNPSSVTAGGSSTLTVSAGAAAVGMYGLTITGTGTSATHTTSIALTITAGTSGGIVNGGFEAGSFSGWTTSGASESVVSSGCHGGTYCARLGATTPTNGDSSAAQTFTVPSGSNLLSLYYRVVCPDTVTYDWATVTLKDNTAGTTTTLLPKTCVASGAWTQVTGAVTGGHSYTLTLTSHDDNYSGDPTYTLYDDVTLTSTAPPPTGITNGGFETGTLAGWTPSGASESVISAGCHSGTYCARLGTTTPTNGDSSINQSFTAPAATTTLSFYYKMTCPDTVTYDWATATLKDNTAGTSKTVLAKTCATNSAYVNVTTATTAGHSYTLTLTSHDDNYSADPSYTLYDDVTIS